MKYVLVVLTALFLLFVFILNWGCSLTEQSVLSQIDKYPEAHSRLLQHVLACGRGVVQGWEGENKCLYTIKVDKNFLIPIEDKTGLIVPPGWKNERPWVSQATNTDIMDKVKFMSELDWSKQGNGICPTRNQGSCGSCWLFSTFQTWRNWWSLYNKVGGCPDLSSEWGVNCEPDDFYGCGGGWWSDGKVKLGAVYTSDYGPYTASNRSCKTNLVNPDPSNKVLETAYIGETGQTATTHEILAALYQYGPVSVTEMAFNAGYGIYDRCSYPWSSSSVNHMTLLFGWVWLDDYGNKTPPGDGNLYFYRQNSWATEDAITSKRIVKASKDFGFKALEGKRRCQNLGVHTVAITNPQVDVPDGGSPKP